MDNNNNKKTEYKLTELGNAKLFVDIVEGQFKYIPEANQWIVWDSNKWNYDIKNSWGLEMQKVSEYYDAIVMKPIIELAKISENPDVNDMKSASYREAKKLKEEIRSINSWQRQCEKNSTMTNALTIAGRQPGVSVSILETDDNPMMLGVLNGVVDIETGELLTDKQARDAFVMQSCGVKYDPDASTGDWEKWFYVLLVVIKN